MQEIDEPLYLRTATVALDPRAARRQAEEYLADYAERRGSPFRALEVTSIEVSTRAVAVEVRAQVPLAFLRIVLPHHLLPHFHSCAPPPQNAAP